MKMSGKNKIVLAAAAVVLTAVVVTVLCVTAANKGPFVGTVTEADGKTPIANISVTDGRNVVKTDENGKFRLKGWRKSRFVTATVAAGYKTDEFYIPVDKKRESYDFVFEKAKLTAREDHCFVQISDTEIGENGTGEWLDEVRNVIRENDAAFLIHTGDICYEAGLKRHIEDMNSDTMDCTVHYVIGNHDYVDGKYGEELYESLYGPVWYSFDVGKVHYVVTSFQRGGDYKSDYAQNDRWKWLENDLANVDEDMKVVMFNHTKSPTDDYVLPLGSGKLDLKQHNLIAWIFGHYHYNYVYETSGVLNISAPRPDCGGIDSSPAGTRVIHIDRDGKIDTQMQYYDLNVSSAPKNAAWSTQLDGNVLYCDTVADGKMLYTATIDDDYPRDCGIYCIDAENGDIKWKYITKNSVKNNVCIDGDRLVAMDTDGNVYCLDKASGTLLWESDLELGNTIGTSSAICIDKGVIYAGGPRIVTALALEDGSVKWSENRDRGENSPAEFIVADGKLIVNSHWDALSALDIENGKELWDNKDEDIRFRSSTPFAADENTLIVADDDAVMQVNLSDGQITKKSVFEDYSFSSGAQGVYDNGVAYIPSSNQGIIAYELKSGEILWTYQTDDNILFTAPYKGKGSHTVESSPILLNGKLIFGANDGCIHMVDAKSGKLIQKYFAGSAVLGQVVVSENKIYAGTFNGLLVCFDMD